MVMAASANKPTVGESPGVSDLDEILRCVGANAGELNTQVCLCLADDLLPLTDPSTSSSLI
jgi:hypothetical protein